MSNSTLSEADLARLGVDSINEGINKMTEQGLAVESSGWRGARLVDDTTGETISTGNAASMFIEGVSIAMSMAMSDQDIEETSSD